MRITINLKRVNTMHFYWKNQLGQTRSVKPNYPTSLGIGFDSDEKLAMAKARPCDPANAGRAGHVKSAGLDTTQVAGRCDERR